MVSKRYVWPSINKDCRELAKSGIDCQKNRIQQHVSSQIACFEPPTERFEHINIDLVSLKSSRGLNQCLTIIDRFTRFPEAVPLSNGNAGTIAHVLSLHWIFRHGVPKRITSDQGPQFESSLFQSLLKMYGIKHLHITPYNPQANDLSEHLHRQLKLALLCHQESLYDALPAVLLGLRAAWEDNIQTTPAELVYRKPIRLPGELLTPTNKTTPHHIVNILNRHFNSLASAEMSRHGKHSVFCLRNLSTCNHVLVRNDQVGPSFTVPYKCPYRVITRHDKYFIVDFRGRQIAISVVRLKPVYEANLIDSTMTITTNLQPNNTATETQKRRVQFNI
ncbi:uncharacterized protein K02A2.6-like [Microplitis demolitor]|uniref:uncharacterized protein K02A2.6-like n=1 Tax=Microplitis demolitor TaxID=69319 RepID=UPI0006D4FB89|nr:uncharacterized protein K02A2.6-like [Microplitis demolitor]